MIENSALTAGLYFVDSTFWRHTVWYILLGITTIIELFFILRKVKNRKLIIAIYLTISGLTFFLEMIIYSYFKSYQYFPMLIPQSPSDDSIAGNLFSQFSVCATALLIAVYKLKYYWYLIFAAAYGAIEEIFLMLGIYKHNWYQTWMTIIGLLLVFWITKKIYLKATNRITPFWRYIFIFFGLTALHQHIIVWVQRLVGIRVLSESFLPDAEQSMVVLSAINNLLLGVPIMIIHFSHTKWRWRILVISVLYGAFYAAAKLDLVIYKEGWFLISSSVCIWSMYIFTYIFDKLYGPIDNNSLVLKRV